MSLAQSVEKLSFLSGRKSNHWLNKTDQLQICFVTFSVSPPDLPSGSPGPSQSPWIASDPPQASVWFFPALSAPSSPAPRNFLPVEKRGDRL